MFDTNETQLNEKMKYYQELFGIVNEETVSNDDCECSVTIPLEDVISSGEHCYE